LSSDVTAMIITEVQELHAISVRENLSEGRWGTWSVSCGEASYSSENETAPEAIQWKYF
jgi:hypothetical protein